MSRSQERRVAVQREADPIARLRADCPCNADHEAAHVPGCAWAEREFLPGLPLARRVALAGEHPGEREGYVCYPKLNHNRSGDAYCWVYRRTNRLDALRARAAEVTR